MTQDTKMPTSAAPPNHSHPDPDPVLDRQLMQLIEQLVLAHNRAHNATLPDARSGLHIQTSRRIEQGRAQAFKSALQLVLHFLQPFITTQHKEHIHAYQLNANTIQRPGPDPDPPTESPAPTANASQ